MELTADEMNNILNEIPSENKIGAKILSKLAMVFSSLWIAVLTVLKGLKFVDLEVTEIVLSGVVITAVWTPTFISIVTDKFVKKL